MAYLNGTTQQNLAPPWVALNSQQGAHGMQFTPERMSEIRERLAAPFHPEEIKWRVTATSTTQTKRGLEKRGQVVAYADQRAYTDRLNEVFGEWGWTRDYDVQVAQNFERRAGADKQQSAVSAKVVVVSKVTIYGLGSHTGVGEEWADDKNAATRAEAQAFKRACACFGLGRYLYDLEKTWVDLDQYNRPLRTPSLPDWALPADAVRQKQPTRQGPAPQELLAQVEKLRQQVGSGLSQFVLKTYGDGATELARVGSTKLAIVCEKLADISRGVERLRKAAGMIGIDRYSVICRELNLSSESVDDIPNRDVLRTLLDRVEPEAAAVNNASQGAGQAHEKISNARGRLLQAARKAADKSRQRLAEVVRQASDGKLTLESLKNLADRDLPLVEAAIARLN